MSGRRKLRRAGAVWRLLVHRHSSDGRYSDMAYHVQSDRVEHRSGDSPHSKTTVLDRTESDELVVGQWLHIEQMSGGVWWMNIAGLTVHVTADRDGGPVSVRVDGPADYDSPAEDCRYSLNWDGLVIDGRVYPPDRPATPASNPTKEQSA